MRFIRRNAIAVTALVFAFTSTGLAASHYVITSTKQIKPSVLKKLHGARGARGRTGATGREGLQGKPGAQGIQGPEGKPGPFPAVLPSGTTLVGVYNAEGVATVEPDFAGDSISFKYPLATAPHNKLVPLGEPATAECPGSSAEPKAAPGWLCVYESESENVGTIKLGASTEPFARIGDFVSVKSKALGPFFDTGSWAVTGD